VKNAIEVDLEKKVIDSKQKKHDLKMQVSQVEIVESIVEIEVTREALREELKEE
jgi:hypothetical protein